MRYGGPLSEAVVASLLWKRTKSVKVSWLTIFLGGGALFGVIDHPLNGELFFSEDAAWDPSLGTIIAVFILLIWGTAVFLARKNPVLSQASEK